MLGIALGIAIMLYVLIQLFLLNLIWENVENRRSEDSEAVDE